jgi:formate hydrogenlyase transcriptional activator
VLLPRTEGAERSRTLTHREMERQHILGVLEGTGWRIKGPNGAAEKLGIKPSTLYSKMNRLGIPTRQKKDGIPT